ncbi:NUDIX domain-containing protein [Sphingobium bisphenolivorans]|uniref:NUDIX domain-containing protein n=1 Tax=Sphingobium bisphenolivorans TaxID=1335760 RepID=UPI00048335B7|nr:NUDIX domain-containing protein [Sphingobium bisphenolivorans]
MANVQLPTRPAATVIIVRDRLSGAPEILMMERASSMVFAAGALVFPGGGVDATDLAFAERLGGPFDLDEAAARIAAIRETMEESGLAIGMSRAVDAAEAHAMRASLLRGDFLADILDAHGLTLALDDLVPFARWHPSSVEGATRVFDTRFYVARAPEGQDASVDATENVHLFWSEAAATIARCDAGEAMIIFPTRRNLERLALFSSFEEVVAHAASIPVEKVMPWIEERDGERHLCIPSHLGYPVTSEPFARAQRS